MKRRCIACAIVAPREGAWRIGWHVPAVRSSFALSVLLFFLIVRPVLTHPLAIGEGARCIASLHPFLSPSSRCSLLAGHFTQTRAQHSNGRRCPRGSTRAIRVFVRMEAEVGTYCLASALRQ